MLLIVLIGVKVSKLDQVPIGTGQRTEKNYDIMKKFHDDILIF